LLSPYQSHKPFDGVWAKSIPSHWDDAFLSALFYEHKLKNIGLRSKNLLSLSYGKIVKKDITDGKGLTPDSYETYNIIAADDIVLRLTDLQNDHKSLRTAISKEEGIVTSAYTTLRRRVEKYNPDYLYFYIHAFDTHKCFYSMGGGIRQSLSYDGIKKISFPIPPRDEQNQIVRFLDWKTSEMAHFIKEKKREIRLLRELRLSLIDNAVTHGINPNAIQKDSGHAWIGNIPEHWGMLYSKKMFALRREKALPDDEQLTSSQKYGIISQKEFMRIENRRLTVVMTGDNILKHVESGDFVISMRSFQGGIEYSTVSGKISSAYVMLIPNHDLVNDRYFKWLLKSPSYIKALQGTSDLVRDGQALRYSNFAKVYLPHVPLAEQEIIAEFLDIMCPQIDEMIDALHQEIIFVQEFRTKTIADVVTGKVDVRNVEIPQYKMEAEEPADEEAPDEESGEENDDTTDEEVDE